MNIKITSVLSTALVLFAVGCAVETGEGPVPGDDAVGSDTAALEGETDGPSFGENGGKGPFTLRCPSVGGFFGRSGDRLDALGLICDNVGQRYQTVQHGGGGGTPFTERCPDNAVAVGIFGRSARIIDQLGLICENSAGDKTNTPYKGGLGGSEFEYACPAGQKIVGFKIRAQRLVDRITPICKAK